MSIAIFAITDHLADIINVDQTEMRMDYLCENLVKRLGIDVHPTNLKDIITTIVLEFDGKSSKIKPKLPPKVDGKCDHIIIRGDKKGKRCPNTASIDGKCKKHAPKSIENQQKLTFINPSNPSNPSNLSNSSNSSNSENDENDKDVEENSKSPQLKVLDPVKTKPITYDEPVEIKFKSKREQKFDDIFEQFNFLSEDPVEFDPKVDFWKNLRRHSFDERQFKWHRKTRLLLSLEKDKILVGGIYHDTDYIWPEEFPKEIINWCKRSGLSFK